MLRKTRGCYRALGIIHSFFGVVSVAVAGTSIVAVVQEPSPRPTLYVGTALLAFAAAAYLALGIGSFLLQSWAAWGTIGFGALSLGLDLLFARLGGCSTIFAVVLVALALSIVLFERKLRAFGVSKNAAMRHGMIVTSADPVIAAPVRVSDGASVGSSGFRETSGDGASEK